MSETRRRSLDACSPLALWAPSRSPHVAACEHGVWIETPFDDSAEHLELGVATIALRDAEREGNSAARVALERVFCALGLQDGRLSPRDEAGRRFLEDRSWVEPALRLHLPLLRSRAERALAQRDRRTSCNDALARAKDGNMIPYDELFPSDWDILLTVEGQTYWAMDRHCPKAECPCTAIVVELHAVTSDALDYLGRISFDNGSTDAPTPLTKQLAAALWKSRAAELQRRRSEARAAIVRFAAASAVSTSSATPSRSAPCPCGSGKKYKRCCAANAPPP